MEASQTSISRINDDHEEHEYDECNDHEYDDHEYNDN
jgi:hypothetical protein